MKPTLSWALLLLAAPCALFAQKADKARDEFFKSDKVWQLALDLEPKELDALRREGRRYVKATLKEGDKIVARDVGIHLKGAAGSYRGIDDKPNVTVNMNKFGGKELFHGMDKFHLTNSLQDPSYLSELLCGELFRAAGIPASRVAHAVVTINGRKRGLFYIKEGYDKYFLKRHFGNDDGNFYDGGFLRDIDQPLQLVRTGSDVKDRADLKELIAASRERDPKTRLEKLEKLIDMDQFLAFMAIEVIAWDWDGYPMKCNNYRIYHDPKKNKMTFIPSGMDQMFGDPNGPLFPGFQGMVARGITDTKEGQERYLKKMDEIMKKVYNADALIKRLDELEARIKPVLLSIDQGAGRDYPNQVNRLRHAVRQRQKSVEDQLKRLVKK